VCFCSFYASARCESDLQVREVVPKAEHADLDFASGISYLLNELPKKNAEFAEKHHLAFSLRSPLGKEVLYEQ
jgi:hypothetical protein